eukprot:3383447-Rhodomonas_salina.1
MLVCDQWTLSRCGVLRQGCGEQSEVDPNLGEKKSLFMATMDRSDLSYPPLLRADLSATRCPVLTSCQPMKVLRDSRC